VLCIGDQRFLVYTKERCYKFMYAQYSNSCGSELSNRCTFFWYTELESAGFSLSIFWTSAGVAVLLITCARFAFLRICGKKLTIVNDSLVVVSVVLRLLILHLGSTEHSRHLSNPYNEFTYLVHHWTWIYPQPVQSCFQPLTALSHKIHFNITIQFLFGISLDISQEVSRLNINLTV
jgi:hypothetical protein